MPLPDGLITGKTARMPGDWKQQPKARGCRHHEPGKMNKREARYALELEARQRAGEILWWEYEPMKLKVAANPLGTTLQSSWLCPDFLVMMADGTLEVHEVKGRWEEDAKEKWKVVMERYWFFKFVLIDR